ncbi:MAG TPA: hypothetical protein DCO79_03420, partial [Spirochaeta sp.]|nr:hypothetical protein [Spirochaeta sp.]
MNNIVILNALNLSEYAQKELYNGRSATAFAVDAASKMPEITDKAVILTPDGDAGPFEGFRQLRIENSSPSGLIEALGELSEGFENIFYYAADCPLVDVQLAEKMYANHIKYFCEYTFADGYPIGLSVEIVKTSILTMLSHLAESVEGGIERNTVFSLIEKDINAFEIETEISPDDQRLLRVALYPDTRRNYIQLRSITDALKRASADSGKSSSELILDTIRSNGGLLRSLPIFFEFETTTSHPQKLTYMPENGGISASGTDEMQIEQFKTALEKISAFSDDAVISLSVRNEPSIHSQAADFAEAVLAYERFSLLIETSGLGWERA